MRPTESPSIDFDLTTDVTTGVSTRLSTMNRSFVLVLCWLFVAAWPALGFAAERPYALDCPADMVPEPGYCIDRYEAPNQKGVRPFTGKGADEGESWCAAQGKRLCTEAEWVRACEGPSHRAYPYGNTYRQGACNDDKDYKPVDWAKINRFPAPSAAAYLDWLDQADASGSRKDCVSEDGVYDLAGNASEWVRLESGYDDAHHNGHHFGMMGCYWSGCYNMHRAAGTKPGCRGTLNNGHSGIAREFRTYESGFRCCSSR